METTGQRFKQIRNELRMSQEAFGESIGLSKAGISAVEKDRTFVSAKILSKLFVDYNINLNWLIVGQGNMFNAPKYEDVKDEILKEVEEMLRKRGIN